MQKLAIYMWLVHGLPATLLWPPVLLCMSGIGFDSSFVMPGGWNLVDQWRDKEAVLMVRFLKQVVAAGH